MFSELMKQTGDLGVGTTLQQFAGTFKAPGPRRLSKIPQDQQCPSARGRPGTRTRLSATSPTPQSSGDRGRCASREAVRAPGPAHTAEKGRTANPTPQSRWEPSTKEG